MSKNIYTLVSDIYDVIKDKHSGWFHEELGKALSIDLAKRLRGQLGTPARKPTLRLSQMGPRCPKALWGSINCPELAEAIPPWAEIKFSFGHILEALVVTLAKAAGHDVQGEQDALILDGIVGHRDCVIDGCTVDVKSASSISFSKFKSLNYEMVDSFGYLEQLDGYVMAASGDPLVTVKDKGFILAVDKQLGHLFLYEHKVTEERKQRLRARIIEYKRVVALDVPPTCQCGTQPEGKSGNIRLDTKASYSAYKWFCHPHLRQFKYASGPLFLTKVVKLPDVPEVARPKHLRWSIGGDHADQETKEHTAYIPGLSGRPSSSGEGGSPSSFVLQDSKKECASV